MMYKKLLLAIFVIALTMFPQQMFAEETAYDLGDIVVTPTRLAQSDYNISSNVTVIKREDIASSNAQTVSDILKQQLGVHIYDNSTYKTATIDIRGFGDAASRNVLVLVNDRKVNSIDITGTDILSIPLGSVERIEIIRGAGSVLYGDNAVGGVVNIITKKGQEDFSGKVGVSYGSYETISAETEVSGSLNKLSYYMYAKRFDTEGYRVNSGLQTKDISSRISYKYSDKLTLDINAGWHEDEYGLPGGLREEEMQASGRRGSADPNDMAWTKDGFLQATADFKPWIGDHEWGHFVFDISYRARETFGEFAAFSFGTQRDIDTIGLTTRYIFDQEMFDKEVNFVTGFDFYDVENDIEGTGSNTDVLTISKRDYGVYGFLEFETLENIFLSAGTRYQRAFYEFDQTAGFTTGFEKQAPHESVSTIGAKYKYAEGSNIFVDVEQTFRFLATDEWYSTFSGLNTSLTQQTGIQYEAGVNHNYQDKIFINVTGYLMDLKNEIFFDPTASFGFGDNANYDKTRRIGLELSQRIDILGFFDLKYLDQLEIYSNITFQNPEFRDGPNDNNTIPMVPREQASLGVNTSFLNYFQANLHGRYVGSQYAINDTLNATAKVKPYFILDGRLSFNYKNLEMVLAVNNILNEKYFSYVSKASSSTAKDYFPAPERNASITVSYSF